MRAAPSLATSNLDDGARLASGSCPGAPFGRARPDGSDYFSRRTPLKGFGSAFWSMNFPVSVSRFT